MAGNPITGASQHLERPGGFTLLELLVSMAVIGILMALLMAAVQAARESARRSACLNNLRQLGIAFQSYHDGLGALPPAVIWSPAGEPLGQGLIPIGVIDRVARLGDPTQDTIYANWAVLLLPYLDQGPLAQQFQPGVPISHDANQKVRETRLPVMSCPTDSWNDERLYFFRGQAVGLADNRYARGNYALNCGPDVGCIAPGTLAAPCAQGFIVRGANLIEDNDQAWGSGLGGVNKSMRYAMVKDGLSHTVIIDEIRAGVDGLDPRGSWALGQIGASATCRHGKHEGLSRPNHYGPPGDYVMGCGATARKIGGLPWDMACFGGSVASEFNATAAARSLHPGGVNALYCDGAAQFVVNTVESTVWHAIHTRDAGEPLDDAD